MSTSLQTAFHAADADPGADQTPHHADRSASAHGGGNRSSIHIPPGLASLPDRDLLVVAVGEQTAAAAADAGIPCVGLADTLSWSESPVEDTLDAKEVAPNTMLVDIGRRYRKVLVLGGSDLLDGADRRGLELLAAALRQRGIRAQLAYCPPGVALERSLRRIIHQGLYEWLIGADGRVVESSLPALFFAAEVSGSSGITDSFNAQIIADLFQPELAYSRGDWYVWDGRIWSRDSDESRRRLALRVAGLYRDYAERLQKLVAAATGAFGKKELPQSLAAWSGLITPVISAALKAATNIQNLRTMDAAFAIAKAHLRVPSDEWDRDPHLLAVHNGVVDLRTGALHPPSPEFRMTRLAGCAYDPGATAPAFQKFLEEVQPDPGVRTYLQRLIGYAATGEAKEQKFFTFLGSGGNGKGTFMGLVMDALGGYALKANAGLLAEQAPDKPRNDLAALAGARLVSISELPSNLRADVALIKWITGGDLITARFLNREFFQFRPCFTPILDTNHPLQLRENTEAATRRPVTIPWNVTVPTEGRDPDLRERLLQELPGILAWIVEGARQYYADGLGSFPKTTGSGSGRSEPVDPLSQWFESCVVRDSGSRVQSTVLYESFCDWVAAEGAKVTMGMKEFSLNLKARAFSRARSARRCGLAFGCGSNPSPPPQATQAFARLDRLELQMEESRLLPTVIPRLLSEGVRPRCVCRLGKKRLDRHALRFDSILPRRFGMLLR